MKELIETIYQSMDEFKKNVESYLAKNNQAAARRARKNTLEMEKLLKQFRKESIATAAETKKTAE